MEIMFAERSYIVFTHRFSPCLSKILVYDYKADPGGELVWEADASKMHCQQVRTIKLSQQVSGFAVKGTLQGAGLIQISAMDGNGRAGFSRRYKL